MPIRIIPCLDVSAGRVVKGVNFTDLRDSGDPVELATTYFSQGADELTFLDVSATVEGRSTTYEVVTACAESIFIPLTVGGGVRTTHDVERLLSLGADKVSVGSAGVSNPALLGEISHEFGDQVLVISLDVKRGPSSNNFLVTTHGGRQQTDLDALEWIRRVQDLGAGELLLNSIDADGTKNGFDLELLEQVRKISRVPLIASGGAGKVEHFVDVARTGVDAILAASVFHSDQISITEVKEALKNSGVEVRLAN